MTLIIRVAFHPTYAMYTDGRWMHRRLMQPASHPQTQTLFRSHDLQGTRFTIVTDDQHYDAERWRAITTELDVRPYAPQVAAEQRRTFSVRLCPITRHAGRTAHALRTDDELALYVERQGERHGFDVLTYTPFWEKGYMLAQDAPALPTVTIRGELEVTNAEAFRAALLGGIGRSKRFGYGLLLTTVSGTYPQETTACNKEA